MRTISIEVWSDYVCPFCYLEKPVLDNLARQERVKVRWRAYELRPEPVPTLDPKAPYLADAWKNSVYPMAKDRGLDLRMPPIQPRSRKAFEAAEFARQKGKFDEMHEALFKAFFVDGKNIGDARTLLEIGGSIGLDPLQLLGSLEARQYESQVLTDQKLAKRLGIQAVPGIALHFVDDPVESGVLVTGAQSFKSLLEIVDRLRVATMTRPVAAPSRGAVHIIGAGKPRERVDVGAGNVKMGDNQQKGYK